MIVVALTAALAALTTFDAIAIRDARRHAKPMTTTLGLIAVCLGLIVGLTVLTQETGAAGPGPGMVRRGR